MALPTRNSYNYEHNERQRKGHLSLRMPYDIVRIWLRATSKGTDTRRSTSANYAGGDTSNRCQPGLRQQRMHFWQPQRHLPGLVEQHPIVRSGCDELEHHEPVVRKN